MPQDVWEYKDPQRPRYPTQKNVDMLRRVILTSSNPGDTVLDCYAGSGTTLVEAAELGRRFIGMDDAQESYRVVRQGLEGIGLFQREKDGFSVLSANFHSSPPRTRSPGLKM